jgi:hypothetical protein
MMGGRWLAEVPCPLRVLARRRGGSAGSRCGVLFFPRVLIPFIRLEDRASYRLRRRRVVQVGVEVPPQRMELLARQAQLARQAGCRLACGHTAP